MKFELLPYFGLKEKEVLYYLYGLKVIPRQVISLKFLK